jgi:hypothetical protein
MLGETEEGWYTDPYSRHAARWFSEGKPTKLVHDAGVESFDEAPDSPPAQAPRRIEEVKGEAGDGDLLRAEDAWGDNSSYRPSMGDVFRASSPPPGRGLPQAGVPPQRPKRKT